jgi:hypothetical protein
MVDAIQHIATHPHMNDHPSLQEMLIPNTNSNPNLNMMAIKVGVKNLTKLFFICYLFL